MKHQEEALPDSTKSHSQMQQQEVEIQRHPTNLSPLEHPQAEGTANAGQADRPQSQASSDAFEISLLPTDNYEQPPPRDNASIMAHAQDADKTKSSIEQTHQAREAIAGEVKSRDIEVEEITAVKGKAVPHGTAARDGPWAAFWADLDPSAGCEEGPALHGKPIPQVFGDRPARAKGIERNSIWDFRAPTMTNYMAKQDNTELPDISHLTIDTQRAQKHEVDQTRLKKLEKYAEDDEVRKQQTAHALPKVNIERREARQSRAALQPDLLTTSHVNHLQKPKEAGTAVPSLDIDALSCNIACTNEIASFEHCSKYFSF